MSIRLSAFVILLLAASSAASAQSLGTFRWQLQPYCNVVALNVTRSGGVFTLDGFDNQCGAATVAPLTGTAVPNPNGSIELGLSIVTSPGSAPVHVAVTLNLATLAGGWKDSAGNTGNFVPTQGGGTGGSPRPFPTAAVPSAFALQSDGGFLAAGALGQGVIPDSGAGTRLMWYPGKAAFRAGEVTTPVWDDLNVGEHSTAFNLDTVASGSRSAAFGHQSVASAPNSAAFGFNTRAAGAHATAMGTGAQANGFSSAAFGTNTVAGGDNSFTAGFENSAGGQHAAAFGTGALANGFASFSAGQDTYAAGHNTVALGSFTRALTSGSFVFGDASTTGILFAPAPNSFAVRADGGTRFYSNAALTAGVVLANGASAWASVSDVNMKENFRDLDGSDVLAKIARMPIREWNYKAQDAAIRHVGPTAQDFHAAFGLGEDPLRISTIDADGIALRAIQALEARMRMYESRIQTLEQEIAALRLHGGGGR